MFHATLTSLSQLTSYVQIRCLTCKVLQTYLFTLFEYFRSIHFAATAEYPLVGGNRNRDYAPLPIQIALKYCAQCAVG